MSLHGLPPSVARGTSCSPRALILMSVQARDPGRPP
jgi:hypothetical protein